MISIKLKKKIDILYNIIKSNSSSITPTKSKISKSIKSEINDIDNERQSLNFIYTKLENIPGFELKISDTNEEERDEILNFLRSIDIYTVNQIFNILNSNLFFEKIKSISSILLIKNYIFEMFNKINSIFNYEEIHLSEEGNLNLNQEIDNDTKITKAYNVNNINSNEIIINNNKYNNKNDSSFQNKAKSSKYSSNNNQKCNIVSSKTPAIEFPSFAPEIKLNDECEIYLFLRELFNINEIDAIEIFDLFKYNHQLSFNENILFILFYLISAYESMNLEEFFILFSEEIFELISGGQKLISINKLKDIARLIGFNDFTLTKYCKELQLLNTSFVDYSKFKLFYVNLGKKYDSQANDQITNISKFQNKKKSTRIDSDCFSKACNIL